MASEPIADPLTRALVEAESERRTEGGRGDLPSRDRMGAILDQEEANIRDWEREK